jgi:glycosyltransferase involved in cell wall biosynthesis
MTHVVFLPSWYPTDAAPNRGTYFRDQARLLSERGHEVGVVFPQQESLRHATLARLLDRPFSTTETSENGVWTVRRRSWNLGWRLPGAVEWRIRDAVRLMRRYVAERGIPDVIHAHSTWWAATAAVRIGESLNRPVIITEHHEQFFFPTTLAAARRNRARRAFASADRVACVSPALRTSLVESGLVDDAAVLPNPVFPDAFPLRNQPLQPPTGTPFRFFALGHLYENKGMDTLIDAFDAAFSVSEADVELVIGGDGPVRPRLQKQADASALPSRIRLAGPLSQSEVVEQMHAAHAFVLPSRRETFGVVLLEALATGLPVVATRSGGPATIVTDRNGFLVPPNVPKDLAAALKRVRAGVHRFHPSDLRQEVTARFGPDVFARRTENLYDQCTASPLPH